MASRRGARKSESRNVASLLSDFGHDLPAVLADLHARNLHSVLVEGGATILNAFLAAHLWDELRILTNPALHLGGGVAAPLIPATAVVRTRASLGGDEVVEYAHTTSSPAKANLADE